MICAKRESFCVKFAQKLFCVFLKKTLASFFSCGINRLVLREWFTQDVKPVFDMNKELSDEM